MSNNVVIKNTKKDFSIHIPYANSFSVIFQVLPMVSICPVSTWQESPGRSGLTLCNSQLA